MFGSHSSADAHLSARPNAARWPSVLRGVDGGRWSGEGGALRMRRKQRLGGCKTEGESAEEDRRWDKNRERESAPAKIASVHVNRKVDINGPLTWHMLCKRGWKKKQIQAMDSGQKNLGRLGGLGGGLATSEWRILPVQQSVMNPVPHPILTPNYCTPLG